MGFRNSLYRFICVGINYIIDESKKSSGKISYAERVFNKMFSALYAPVSTCSYSQLVVFRRLLDAIRTETITLPYENFSRICKLSQEGIDGAILVLDKEICNRRRDIVRQLPFGERGKKIGIYGGGNHTERLIEEYRSMEEIRADLVYIHSYGQNNSRTSLITDSICFEDIPDDVGCIVLSSWLYHNEILLNIMRSDRWRFRLIDLYEFEKIALY